MGDRDIRSGYVSYTKRGSLRDDTPSKIVNGTPPKMLIDNSSNFSVTSKKLSKLMGLAAALENTANYVDLIDRSVGSLDAVQQKLYAIEDMINASATVFDSDDYVTKPVGAISKVSLSGISAGLGTFTNIGQTSTSGNGNGALFNISTDGVGNYIVNMINQAGTGYEKGDVLKIAGSVLGGLTPNNDATIIINTISPLAQTEKSYDDAVDDIERASLQLKADSLVDDIAEILDTALLNKDQLFSGMFANKNAQVGYHAPADILVDIQTLNTGNLGEFLSADYTNADFSILADLEGTLTREDEVNDDGVNVSLDGWDIGLEQVSFAPFVVASDASSGFIRTTLGGYSTPTDSTPTPSNNEVPARPSKGDDNQLSAGDFTYEASAGILKLSSENLRVASGDVVHGPYLVSKNAVQLNGGDVMSFSWKAENNNNAYDALAYLLNSADGSTIEMLNATGDGNTGWVTAQNTIATAGDYKFVFVAGSFDYDFEGSIAESSITSGNSVIDGVTSTIVASGTSDFGGVISAMATGTSVGAGTYSGLTQSSTSGAGSGASFTITADGVGNYNINAITAPGTNYKSSDSITIDGGSLGGSSGVNDLAISLSNVGGASFTGITQTTSSGSGSGAVFNISTTNTGGYSVDAITTLGSGYAPSDTITIAGSALGGASPAHDLLLNISTIGVTRFVNKPAASTSGNGTGAFFNISIDGAGNYTNLGISNTGSGYQPSDTVTISGADLGGASTANDLRITISEITADAGASLFLKDLAITRAADPDNILRGIDLSSQTSASSARNVIAAAIDEVRYRKDYLEGKKAAIWKESFEANRQELRAKLVPSNQTDRAVEDSLQALRKQNVLAAIKDQLYNANWLMQSGVTKLL